MDSGNISRPPCQSPDAQDDAEYPFEDADLDDGLDPAMKEELDRWASYGFVVSAHSILHTVMIFCFMPYNIFQKMYYP